MVGRLVELLLVLAVVTTSCGHNRDFQGAPTRDALEETVVSVGNAVFARDQDTLSSYLTEDCRSRLASLPLLHRGLDQWSFLAELNPYDRYGVRVGRVTILDFWETGATVVAESVVDGRVVFTQPAEEATLYVFERDRWRSTDCHGPLEVEPGTQCDQEPEAQGADLVACLMSQLTQMLG